MIVDVECYEARCRQCHEAPRARRPARTTPGPGPYCRASSPRLLCWSR